MWPNGVANDQVDARTTRQTNAHAPFAATSQEIDRRDGVLPLEARAARVME